MDGWLVSWMPAGRSFVDQIVTLLPNDYEADDVEKILRALFNVGSFRLSETVNGLGVPPQLHVTPQANGYVRITIEVGSFAMETRRVRNVRVFAGADDRETITWEEPNYKGEWSEKSYTRTRVGRVSFDIE